MPLTTLRAGDLVVGEEPQGRIVEGRAAEQPDLGIAVQVDLVDEVVESNMNWPAGLLVRSAAADSAASARSTTNNGPKTSFIATKAAAMPQPVRKNCRRSRAQPWRDRIGDLLHPFFNAALLRHLWQGLNSTFEMIWVGSEWNAARSVGSVCESSDLLNRRPIEVLPRDWRGMQRRGPGRTTGRSAPARVVVVNGVVLYRREPAKKPPGWPITGRRRCRLRVHDRANSNPGSR